MFTQRQMDHYLEKGWVIIEVVFYHAVLDSMQRQRRP